jgi:hypothetical protein
VKGSALGGDPESPPRQQAKAHGDCRGARDRSLPPRGTDISNPVLSSEESCKPSVPEGRSLSLESEPVRCSPLCCTGVFGDWDQRSLRVDGLRSSDALAIGRSTGASRQRRGGSAGLAVTTNAQRVPRGRREQHALGSRVNHHRRHSRSTVRTQLALRAEAGAGRRRC